MLLSELIDATYVQTLRPDQVAKTTAAVKSATLLAHHSDFYPKDLFESGVAFDESLFMQSLDTGIIANYRKIKYLRMYDLATTTALAYFDILTPDELVDSYGSDKTNVAYEAGTQLELRGAEPFQHVLIGAYISPDVTDVGYLSWIADTYPYAIIYTAARIVLASNGNREGARDMQELANEQLSEMKMNAIATVGS